MTSSRRFMQSLVPTLGVVAIIVLFGMRVMLFPARLPRWLGWLFRGKSNQERQLERAKDEANNASKAAEDAERKARLAESMAVDAGKRAADAENMTVAAESAAGDAIDAADRWLKAAAGKNLAHDLIGQLVRAKAKGVVDRTSVGDLMEQAGGHTNDLADAQVSAHKSAWKAEKDARQVAHLAKEIADLAHRAKQDADNAKTKAAAAKTHAGSARSHAASANLKPDDDILKLAQTATDAAERAENAAESAEAAAVRAELATTQIKLRAQMVETDARTVVHATDPRALEEAAHKMWVDAQAAQTAVQNAESVAKEVAADARLTEQQAQAAIDNLTSLVAKTQKQRG